MEEQKKNPAQGLSESEQVQVRRQKLADLQAAGHDPFTLTKYPQDAYSADLKAEFADLPNETRWTSVYNAEQMAEVDTNLYTAAFGQNESITPMQMATAGAALANRG